MSITGFKLIILCAFASQVYPQTNGIPVKNPDYIKSYDMYLQGDEFYHQKKYELAIHEYKKAIKKFRQYPENYYKLSMIYLLKQEYGEAEHYILLGMKYKHYFKDRADLAGFYRTAAQYYEKVNKNNQALDHYLSLIKIQSNLIYRYKSGVLYYRLNKPDDALDALSDFRKAFLAKGSVSGLKEEYKNCLKIMVNINTEKNNFTEAYELLKEIYIKYPEEDVLDKLIILSNNLKHYKKD